MITVYVDVLFLINFSVDYIVLLLTAGVFHFEMKKWRGILVSVGMAIYGLWALLMCGSYLLLILSAVLSVLAACRMAFPIRGVKMLVKCMFVYTALSFLCGGLVELLFRMTRNLTGSMAGERDGIQVLVFAGLALASAVMIHIGNRLLDRGRGVKYIHLSFSLPHRTFKAMMLVDSGNMACEPLSGRHVVFLTEKYAQKSGFKQYINNNEEILKFKRVICIDTANGRRAIEAYICNEIKLQNKTVGGAIAVMQSEINDICDGVFPSALL